MFRNIKHLDIIFTHYNKVNPNKNGFLELIVIMMMSFIAKSRDNKEEYKKPPNVSIML